MKILTAAIFVVILLNSCKKEVESTQSQPLSTVTTDIFEFDFNGVHYVTTDVISSGIISNTLSSTGINDNGTSDAYDNMSLAIHILSPTVGIFQLDSGSMASDYISLVLPATSSGAAQEVLFSQFSSNAGSVTIIEIDYVNNRIRGTFETEVTNGLGGAELIINNGEFDIPFIE